MSPLERAARALCTLDGKSEDAAHDGKPLWQDYLPEARAALSQVRMEWRAMKTAPLDDTPVLLFVPAEQNPRRRIMVGMWETANRRWIGIPGLYRLNPSCWLPLPPDPEG